MAEKVPSINLLPHQGESFLTQFLNWTLSIGRLLIILVEMLALGTFLYRFTLDMQIIDLRDKIKAQSFIVANFESSEKNFRDIQERLAHSKRYDSIGATTTKIFSDVTTMGKGNVTFLNLTVEPEIVKIEAEAPSATSLSAFVTALRKHPSVTAVSLDKLENSTTTALVTVSITANLKALPFEKDDQQNNTAGTDQLILENQQL